MLSIQVTPMILTVPAVVYGGPSGGSSDKDVAHLLEAANQFNRDTQLVLRPGAPDSRKSPPK
jgi:hypothetical protein